MANEVHRDDIVLPGNSHVTAMESIKDEVGLKASATTAPGLLKLMSAATASRDARAQRRLGSALPLHSKSRGADDSTTTKTPKRRPKAESRKVKSFICDSNY